MTASPPTQLIAPGMDTEYDVEVTAEGAVNPIDLDHQWIGAEPNDVTVTLEDNQVHPGGDTVNETKAIVETQETTAPDEYTLRIWANGTDDSAITDYADVNLIVEDEENFYITGIPDHQKIGAGSDFGYQINVSAINNFTDDVNLSVVDVVPSTPELSYDFESTTLTSPYPNETVLNVYTTDDIEPDIYEITVQGVGGGKQHNTTVELEVVTGLNAEIHSPIEDELVSGEYTFQADASYTGGEIEDVDLTFGGNMSSLGTISTAYSSSSGLWERDVKTDAYPDGYSTVEATAITEDGAIYTSDSVRFETKNTPPNPKIKNPSDHEYVSDDVQIEVETSEKVSEVQFRIDDQAWQPMTGGPPTWTASWDTTTVSDGLHEITVEATDEGGLTGQSGTEVYVDNNPPNIDIVSPVDNETIEGKYKFQALAEDTVKVDRVNITVFGETISMIYNEVTGYYERSLRTSTVSDGDYTAHMHAWDRVGHESANQSVNFQVANTPPSMTIHSPKSGEIVNNNYTLMAEVESDFLETVEYRVDDGSWETLEYNSTVENHTADWDTTAVPDGPHTLTFRAVDEVGHETEVSREIKVDNTPPTGTVIEPLSGEFISGEYTFRITASDEVAIDKVEINVFGGTYPATYNQGTGYYEYSIDTTSIDDGEYTVNATIEDEAGWAYTTGDVTFEVDNSAPGVSIENPAPNSYVSGNVSIEANITDMYLDSVEVKIDEGTWRDMGESNNIWTYEWDTTDHSEGEHQVHVKAMDESGKSTTQNIYVIVDNENPTASIVSPNSDADIQGTYTFQVSATDKNGVDEVSINVFGGNYTAGFNQGTGFYEKTIITTTVEDGDYAIEAIVEDESGKELTVGPTNFSVDNTAPAVDIVEPGQGDYVSGEIEINATTHDEFLKDSHYRIDGGSWNEMDIKGNYSTAYWNTTKFSEGSHRIDVLAVDEIGHRTTDSIDILVDNKKPTGSIASPYGGEYISGSFTFQVSAADENGIDQVEVEVFNQTYTAEYNSGTGMYELVVVTTTVEDGTYNISATIEDNAGWEIDLGPLEFYVNNEEPSLSILKPEPGDIMRGTSGARVKAEDKFLSEVRYRVDDSEWKYMEDVGNEEWTSIIETSNFTDGEHNLQFEAVDRGGLRTAQSVEVVFDNTAPDGEIITPSESDFIDERVRFQVNAEDEVGVKKVMINFLEVEGENASDIDELGTQKMYYDVTTGSYLFEVATFRYTDGKARFNATVIDKAGFRTDLEKVDFLIDNSPPEVEYQEPLQGDYVSGTVNITAEIDDDPFIPEVDYRINERTWSSMEREGDVWTAEWDTTTIVDGKHTIAIRSRDDVGHVTLNEIEITVDNHKPEIEVLNPVSDQFIEGDLTFQIRAADEVGVRSVELDIYALVRDEPHTGHWTMEATYNPGTGYHEATLDTTLEQEDGYWNMTAYATDQSGKRNITDTIEFRVVNHDPSLTIHSPQHGEYVSDQVEIDAEVEDAFPGPAYYSVDEGGWTPIIVPWNTTGYSDGEHRLDVKATDQAGNSVVRTIRVTVINTEPEASIVSPIEDQFVEDWFQFRVNARHEVEVDNVEAELFDDTLDLSYDRDSGYYVYEIDTRNIADGTYTFEATATDPIGNTDTTNTITFHVDNNPPVLDINSPKNGEYIRDTVELNVTAEDEYLEDVKYSVDDTGFVPIEEELNTTRLSDGDHTITVRAIDEAGHTTTRKVTVIVDNIAPTIRVHSPRREEVISGEHELEVFVDSEVQEVMIEFPEEDLGPFTMEKTAEENRYSYLLDSTELTGKDGTGVFDVRVSVKDVAGHERGRQFEITVDNAGPMIEMVGPVDNIGNETTVKGSTTFSLNVSSLAGVEDVQINIEGRGWQDMMLVKNNTYMYQWEAGDEEDGDYTYVIRIEDSAGNVNQYSGSIEVENPPDYWQIFQNNIPGISFLLIVILIIFILYLSRNEVGERIKREEKDEDEEEEGDKEGKKRFGWISSSLGSDEEEGDEEKGKERAEQEKGKSTLSKSSTESDEGQEEESEMEQAHPIEKLDLNSGVEVSLNSQGITSIEALTEKTKDELMDIEGIEEKRAEHIQDKLNDVGLSLKSGEAGNEGEQGLMESVMEADLPSDKE
ncbi:MAG: Ig-like domain-containing protein [Candidatus Thermoplasmatota archaeon]